MNVLGKSIRSSTRNRRHISQWIQVPVIFTGLLATLWTWKSLMLVIFQRKIIFMPYIGRHERLEDHATGDVRWTLQSITTRDNVRLALCQSSSPISDAREQGGPPRRVRIVYLQGNAGSTPPRLPSLSRVLGRLRRQGLAVEGWTVAYRGYWQSTGTPTEAGLRRDVEAAMHHIQARETGPVETVIWGHSMGASLALDALRHIEADAPVRVVLETPFDGIASLLEALYPQRWLPYRYLAPFLTTRFDLASILSALAEATSPTRRIDVLAVRASTDEIVPRAVHDRAVSLLRDSGLFCVREVVCKGLHQDLIFKNDFQDAVVDFVKSRQMHTEEKNESGQGEDYS